MLNCLWYYCMDVWQRNTAGCFERAQIILFVPWQEAVSISLLMCILVASLETLDTSKDVWLLHAIPARSVPTPWGTFLLEKHSRSRNSPHFMEPEGSLPCSQEPASSPYPEPDESTPQPHTLFLINVSVFQVVSTLQDFLIRILNVFLYLSHACYVPANLYPQYMVKTTKYESSRYAVLLFSNWSIKSTQLCEYDIMTLNILLPPSATVWGESQIKKPKPGLQFWCELQTTKPISQRLN
jgi:hypothetical protein